MSVPNTQLCNIAGREISKRWWVGVAALAACMAIEVGFVVMAASRWWRLLLLPLLYIAILGFMQAHARVCVRNAIKGTRNMGDVDLTVEVETERSALRGRAITIIAQAVAGALIMTTTLILLH